MKGLDRPLENDELRIILLSHVRSSRAGVLLHVDSDAGIAEAGSVQRRSWLIEAQIGVSCAQSQSRPLINDGVPLSQEHTRLLACSIGEDCKLQFPKQLDHPG